MRSNISDLIGHVFKIQDCKYRSNPCFDAIFGQIHVRNMEEWLNKMRKWCSIRERCEHDIRAKLKKADVADSEIQQLIARLIDCPQLTAEQRVQRDAELNRSEMTVWQRRIFS